MWNSHQTQCGEKIYFDEMDNLPCTKAEQAQSVFKKIKKQFNECLTFLLDSQ